MPPGKESAPANASPGAVDGWDLDDWWQAERERLAAGLKKRPGRRRKSEPIAASVESHCPGSNLQVKKARARAPG